MNRSRNRYRRRYRSFSRGVLGGWRSDSDTDSDPDGLRRYLCSGSLEPELAQAGDLSGPVSLHADVQLEEDARTEQRLDVDSRRLADGFDARAAAADQDRLLRLARDVHGRADHRQ